MKNLFKIFIGFFLSTTLFANSLQLSLPGTNIPKGNVNGLRLSLLSGETKDVNGLNLSLGFSSVQNFKGLHLGLFIDVSKIENDFKGISLSTFNWQKGESTGLNLGFINYINNINGLNLGAFNYIEQNSNVNFGFINYTNGHSDFDFGAINYSESSKFQIGIFNATKNLDGLQIGFINYAQNGIFKVLPLINFKKTL